MTMRKGAGRPVEPEDSRSQDGEDVVEATDTLLSAIAPSQAPLRHRMQDMETVLQEQDKR